MDYFFLVILYLVLCVKVYGRRQAFHFLYESRIGDTDEGAVGGAASKKTTRWKFIFNALVLKLMWSENEQSQQ